MNREELINEYGEKYLVWTCMNVYGGGFVQTLAQLIARADDKNLEKIKSTWPEYWEQYLAMHVKYYRREGEVL